jgi:hypothetical protein
VPEGVREGFSKRSGQVDAKLAELVRRWSADHDGSPPGPRTIAKLERDAAANSRPAKGHAVDAQALHAEWADEARAIGFDPATLVPEQIAVGRSPLGPIPDEDLVDEAVFHATEEASAWLRADLARHLATIIDADTAPTGDALVTEIDRLAALTEARCVALGPEHDTTTRHRADGRPVTEHVTDRRFTTPLVLDQEHDLRTWATANTRPVEPAEDPQAAASAAIAGWDRLVLVIGPAGTGKTTATARAVASLQADGRPVVGLAPPAPLRGPRWRVRLLVRHPSDPHPRRTPALHPTMGSRRQPPPACRAPRRRRGLRRPRSRSRHPPGARRRPRRPRPPAPRR